MSSKQFRIDLLLEAGLVYKLDSWMDSMLGKVKRKNEFEEIFWRSHVIDIADTIVNSMN